MAHFFEATFKIDSRDTDTFGLCRPSALLAYLQEVANLAAEEIHVSREETLEKYNCFWMLVRIWYRLDKPIRQFDEITFKTWHRGDKGVIMYRDFDLLRNGERIGEVVSAWVLADWDNRKMLRLSKVMEFSQTTGGELCKELQLRKLKLPVEMEPIQERTVTYSDLDVNGHVNNTKYADYICDAVKMEQLGQTSFVSGLQIGYEAECKVDDTLRIFLHQGKTEYFVRGDDFEGKNRFESSFTLSPLPEQWD
jgi:medium-chain acyl-[acyl-carrier-protein] hydrolase